MSIKFECKLLENQCVVQWGSRFYNISFKKGGAELPVNPNQWKQVAEQISAYLQTVQGGAFTPDNVKSFDGTFAADFSAVDLIYRTKSEEQLEHPYSKLAFEVQTKTQPILKELSTFFQQVSAHPPTFSERPTSFKDDTDYDLEVAKLKAKHYHPSDRSHNNLLDAVLQKSDLLPEGLRDKSALKQKIRAELESSYTEEQLAQLDKAHIGDKKKSKELYFEVASEGEPACAKSFCEALEKVCPEVKIYVVNQREPHSLAAADKLILIRAEDADAGWDVCVLEEPQEKKDLSGEGLLIEAGGEGNCAACALAHQMQPGVVDVLQRELRTEAADYMTKNAEDLGKEKEFMLRITSAWKDAPGADIEKRLTEEKERLALKQLLAMDQRSDEENAWLVKAYAHYIKGDGVHLDGPFFDAIARSRKVNIYLFSGEAVDYRERYLAQEAGKPSYCLHYTGGEGQGHYQSINRSHKEFAEKCAACEVFSEKYPCTPEQLLEGGKYSEFQKVVNVFYAKEKTPLYQAIYDACTKANGGDDASEGVYDWAESCLQRAYEAYPTAVKEALAGFFAR
jgi:hypothetical protein